MKLDKVYRLAQTIKRSMQQVEYAPAMSADEAITELRALWSDNFLRDILKRME